MHLQTARANKTLDTKIHFISFSFLFFELYNTHISWRSVDEATICVALALSVEWLPGADSNMRFLYFVINSYFVVHFFMNKNLISVFARGGTSTECLPLKWLVDVSRFLII